MATKISRTTREIYLPYNPDAITEKILEGAWDYIQSVEYQPGGREVFYNLFDRGFFSKRIQQSIQRATKNKNLTRLKFIKEKPKAVANRYYIDYTKNARRRFYKEWQPTTFPDESRSVIEDNLYFWDTNNAWDWIDEDLFIKKEIHTPDPPTLGKFPANKTIIEIWFETSANTDFFRQYTNGMILRPFSGQYSIEKKWQAYQQILEYNRKWSDKKVHILYFGDYDLKGNQIPETAVENIRAWGEAREEPVNFEFHRIGLNEEHIKKFKLPDNPDKPGAYQWEALDVDKRIKLLEDSVKKYLEVDELLLEKIKENQSRIGSILREELENFGYSSEYERVENSGEFEETIIKRLKEENIIEDRDY